MTGADTTGTPPPPPRNIGKGANRPLTDADLDCVHGVLATSLENRLVADVPVCLLLSAGIDSPLIAAIARHDLGRQLDAITVRFTGGYGDDESDGALAIAKHLDIPCQRIESKSNSAAANARALLGQFGQPNDNLGIIAVQQVCEAAQSAGYRVGLTGMGGDELFFGYNKYLTLHRYRHLLAMPWPCRSFLSLVLKMIPGLGSKARTWERLIAVRDHERYLAVKNIPMIAELRTLPQFHSWAKNTFKPWAEAWVEAADFDLRDTMPNSQLVPWDKGSMAASMELRTPFLSRPLVDTLSTFGLSALASHGGKSVLRRLLRRYLPDDLVRAGKSGFVFPGRDFLKSQAEPWQNLHSLPGDFTDMAHENRHDYDWERIALRLTILDAFIGKYQNG